MGANAPAAKQPTEQRDEALTALIKSAPGLPLDVIGDGVGPTWTIEVDQTETDMFWDAFEDGY
jgi:hypothetical protein